jgi:hypothetical protein
MKMIGKPEWFTYRKMGWGITPKTWQGWVYIAAVTAVTFTIGKMPLFQAYRLPILLTFCGLVLLDVGAIMVAMGRFHDERDRWHQLVIERNCSFTAVAAITAVIIYQVWEHKQAGLTGIPFDPYLAGVLGLMAVVKLISTIYLRMKM